jgi:hypothetical protein
LAVSGTVAIAAHANTDIPSPGSASAVDINADGSAAPVYSFAAPTSIDVDVDIAALLSATCPSFTGLHLCALFRALIATLVLGRAWSHVAATGPLFVGLHFEHEPFKTGRLVARERHYAVSACGEDEYRYCGAQHQQLAHFEPSFGQRFASATAEAFRVNVRMEERFLS